MTVLVTRIAPTPSGYLHLGNAVNFELTSWLARVHGGRLLLRIDDFDVDRVRNEYLDDVFRTVTWLGIDIADGPSGPADFHAAWSMAHRDADFRAARRALMRTGRDEIFVCRCARRELVDGRCTSGCRSRDLALAPGESALRLRVAARAGPGGPPPGDHVLWRRDDQPAYLLGSVVVDEAQRVTAIVRGADLREASALQSHLAGMLPAPVFAVADVRHHALVRTPTGDKLSKSAGARAQPMEHTPSLREEVRAAARDRGAQIGISPP